MSKKSIEEDAKKAVFGGLSYAIGIVVMVPLLTMLFTKLGVKLGG